MQSWSVRTLYTRFLTFSRVQSVRYRQRWIHFKRRTIQSA
jgi:hypothetical protein